MEYGTLEGVLKCVEHGLGVTVLPMSMIESRAESRLNTYPLEDPYRGVPTVFIRRRDTYRTAALSRFMETAGIVVP